jgi:hypothetical protein
LHALDNAGRQLRPAAPTDRARGEKPPRSAAAPRQSGRDANGCDPALRERAEGAWRIVREHASVLFGRPPISSPDWPLSYYAGRTRK